ncbi:metallophosphoesterase family protein [Bradyrhizobium sp. SRS-191]|uniref:metallophosphoesterase family protein n=1 Tax=Bradyrhizobium sp. SRS-191 TaxID=2962606 RepID=UPI0035BC8D07
MRKTYVIGDIHGCLRQLRGLVDRCRLDCGEDRPKFIFIGDYIDRGPDSHGVVEFLMGAQKSDSETVICLRGNHEALALLSTYDTANVPVWLHNGGEATLLSYRVGTPAEMPHDHICWFQSLPIHYDDGLRFFVHAGIDPNKPLNQQAENDCLWMREPFLSDRQNYSRLVVHGHTPTLNQMPEQRTNRLNVDTGAYLGGPLTAAIFDDRSPKPLGFLQEY